ncbi:MAG TPA: hypothetical protein VD970_03370 [Acetobacteraceae bacterium]|nr:hypothetical protein [Acetobacteraceae bacterium]
MTLLRALALLLPLLAGAPARGHGIPIPDWLPRHAVTIQHGIAIPTRGPTPGGVREQAITGMLHRPDRPGPMPAAVIVNSSGGVDSESEIVWASYLAELGMAVLVVDSFTARGIRRTSRDQSLLDQFWSSHDGAAGWRWLARQDVVDRERILILGMSRGAVAAIANAIVEQRRQMRVEDTRFAAHVAISPGCSVQQRNPESTGAPILFLLGELDDYTPIGPCLDYAARIEAAGNAQIRRAVYPGGFHAPEMGWGSEALPDVETWNRCLLLRHPGGAAFQHVETGRTIPGAQIRAYGLEHCLRPGGSVGGDMRLRRQMGADLLRFLMEHGFVRDEAMRAALPDCAALPEERGVRRSCLRAAAGWGAEAGRLGWLYANGLAGLPRDPARATALTRIAAERGEPHAQTNLATWLRTGTQGLARDAAAAREWAARADAQGHGGGANELGLLAEAAGDHPAARAHFRRAAERYNRFGMSNLGRYLAGGLGGPAEPAEAERWLRLAIHYENPWAHLALARALEAGQLGRPPDPRAALEGFRAAAAIAFAGQEQARREAARLEAALSPGR